MRSRTTQKVQHAEEIASKAQIIFDTYFISSSCICKSTMAVTFAMINPVRCAVYADGLLAKFKFLDENWLNGSKKFIVGDKFTVADAYLYIVLSWAARVNIDLTPYKNVKAYFDGIAALDSVKSAHALVDKKSPTTVA